MDLKEKALLEFQIVRHITMLYKEMLDSIKDMSVDHQGMLDKIVLFFPELKADIGKIDYFTEEKYNHIRKRILDRGNAAIRELQQLLEKFEIHLK